MKTRLICAALLLFAGEASAQQHTITPSCTSQGYWNSGGGYGSLSSYSMGRPVRWEPPREYTLLYARNDGEFVPTTFMKYEDALALGKQQLAEQEAQASGEGAFSLGEIARAYRADRVPTFRLRSRITQDSTGKLQICNLNGNECRKL